MSGDTVFQATERGQLIEGLRANGRHLENMGNCIEKQTDAIMSQTLSIQKLVDHFKDGTFQTQLKEAISCRDKCDIDGVKAETVAAKAATERLLSRHIVLMGTLLTCILGLIGLVYKLS